MPLTNAAERHLEDILESITSLSLQINNASNLIDMLNITVQQARSLLGSDRALIYQFLPEGDGVVMAESVGEGWKEILGELIGDPCFHSKYTQLYQVGRYSAIDDTHTQQIEACYADLLARMQVRANLVMPILVDAQPSAYLYGLLIMHQCDRPRQWKPLEISLLRNITTQLGIALGNAKFQVSITNPDKIPEQTTQPIFNLAEYCQVSPELLWKDMLLQTLSEASPLAFLVVDNRTDNILYFNHYFCEIWNIEHLESKMQSGELKNNDIIPDCIPLIADLPAFIDSCKPLQSEENRIVIEDEIQFVDKRTIRRFSKQIRDRQDRYFGRLYIFEDITERKQREHTLKVDAERRQFAIESSGDGIWDWNVKTNEVFFSHRWKAMLGFEDSEISNDFSEWNMRVHPEDIEIAYAEIFKHFLGETSQYEIEHRLQCKDGSYKWILTRGKIFSRAANGAPLRFLGTHVDISDRKRSELALQESEAQQRAILEAIPDLLLRVHRDGSCLDFMVSSITNKNQFEPIQRHLSEVLPTDLLQRQLQAIEQAIATKQLQIYKHQLLKFGKLAYEEVRVAAINSNEALVIVRDITDQVASAQRLEQISRHVPGVIYQYHLRTDGSSYFPYASQGIRDIYDVSPEDVCDDASVVFSRIYPEDLELVVKTIAESSQNLTVWQCEYRVQFDDGRINWVHGRATPQRQADGSILWHGYINEITDRKLDELALKDSREKLREAYDEQNALFAAMSDVVLVRNAEGNCLKVVPTKTANLLATPKEVISKTIYEQLPWSVASILVKATREALETQKIVNCEYSLDIQGKEVWFDANISPVSEDRVIQFARDITERKQIEIALRESESRFQELVNLSPSVIYTIVKTPNGANHFEFVSPIFEEIHEISITEAYQNASVIIDLMHPDDRQGYQDAVNDSLNSMQPFHYEWRIITPSGKIKWLRANSCPVLRENGEIVRHGVLIDISDLKQAEAELKKVSERLTLSLKSGAIGCWNWDINQNIIFWDDRMYELYAVTKQSDFVTYDVWSNIVHPEDLSYVEISLQQAILGHAEYDTEFRIICPDHSIHFIKAYGTLVRDVHGSPQSMIGINFDITDRKLIEIELANAKQDAEAATKAKSKFLANMSHELRTPMNGVLGIVELLASTNLTAEQQNLLQILQHSGDTLVAIVNDILDFSKIEAGMMTLEAKEFVLEDILSSICKLLNKQALDKQIQLNYEIASHLPSKFIGDSTRLHQILLNLIGNAIKFTQSGHVAIAVNGQSPADHQTEPYKLIFKVRDTGIGIQREYLTELFQAFTQADASISRRYGGTGLGLAITKRLVELMGGTIWAESFGHVGGNPPLNWLPTLDSQGSTFYFAIALFTSSSIHQSPKLDISELPIDTQMAEKLPLRILLVEDNVFNQKIASLTLERLGYQADIANNGLEALNLVQQKIYDLVLMDVHMPEMDGLTATKLIRDNIRYRPWIVAMTANVLPEDRQACFEAGMNDYLSKPFKIQEIVQIFSNYIHSKEDNPTQTRGLSPLFN